MNKKFYKKNRINIFNTKKLPESGSMANILESEK
jgi:hypothetical protein